MKKKQLQHLAGLLLMILVLGAFVWADDQASIVKVPINIYVEGRAIQWTDALPFIDENARTMIPLRAVAENLGAEVSWDDKTSTATVKLGDKVVDLPVGRNYGMVNGVKKELDTKTVVSNGRTFVPLRFLSESIGFSVDYNFGKDPQANGLLSHMITLDVFEIHTIDVNKVATFTPLVEKDRRYLTLEEEKIYFSWFKKIPASNEGGEASQVMQTSGTFYLSANSTDVAFFNIVFSIEFKLHLNKIVLTASQVPTGWDEFVINSLTAILGEDGTVIGTQFVKDYMSVYNAEDNVYYGSKLRGKVITSGKYTYDHSTLTISWEK